MPHRLDPLLNPESIVIVGATTSGGMGTRVIKNLQRGGFKGKLYGLHPKNEDAFGIPCYPDFKSLPEKVEHAIFAVSDERVEGLVDAAIEAGVKAMSMMSMLYLDDDQKPYLKDRIQTKLKEADILLCGANGMGFFHIEKGVWVNGHFSRPNHEPGGVCIISQSGSGVAGIIDCEERINLNLSVSSGSELTVGAEDYLDYILHQQSTTVVGLFLETIRKPNQMIKSFELANEKRIPIVVLKTGRTERSAELTVSHSGGLAGVDDCYNALFDKYGIQRVSDMDELATTLIMFDQPHALANGNMVSMHDSGGERQLIIDIADRQGVEFAELDEATTQKLEEILDPGLPPVNPLDAWGKGLGDADQIMIDSMIAMLSDSNASMGAIVMDRGPLGKIFPEYVDYLEQTNQQTGKPVFLVSNRQGTGTDPLVLELSQNGMPVIDGLHSFLAGVRCLHQYRDFLSMKDAIDIDLDSDALKKYQDQLDQSDFVSEAEALNMFFNLGLSANQSNIIENEEELVSTAKEMVFPLVLKTAVDDVYHKSELSGVYLNIDSEDELRSSYKELQEKLPGNALLAKMIQSEGVEMIVGMTTDQQLGPMVTIGFGGYYAEAMNDAITLMPPFSKEMAKKALSKLKMKTLLEGYRGSKPADLDAFSEFASRFSVIAVELSNQVCEIDLNPVILGNDNCIAVDALISLHQQNK
ncbi:MAG TPA: acetate--CoA ligase family protein [Gammaproteobacteria bacterium]|nr:acetate--CoA ligase family protein [Gammaproteobacteria bacterium]